MRRVRPGLRALASLAVGAGVAVLLSTCSPAGDADSRSRQEGPYVTSYTTITTTNPATGNELVADIHFPTDTAMSVGLGDMAPVLVFVPGTSTPRGSYSGNAQQLATWGYFVALPGMPKNDLEVRASDVRHLLSYLETLSANPESVIYRAADLRRVGMVGHSLGAITPLMIGARGDPPIQAAVGLDPVNPDGNSWDYELEGGRITAPVLIVGAPSHTCNWFARYRRMLPHLGSAHRVMITIRDGGHCDFLDPGIAAAATLCGLACGGYSEERLALTERYTTAWFDYYLRQDGDAFTILYGDEANDDIQEGLIDMSVETAPGEVRVHARAGAIEVRWRPLDHPVIAGYNVYRREEGGPIAGTPSAQLGMVSSFVDSGVVPGRVYYYVVRSRDAAGNEHAASSEVGGVAAPGSADTRPDRVRGWAAAQ